MRPISSSAAESAAASLVFTDGVRRMALVIDRALRRERLATRVLAQAAARARDMHTLEAQVAALAESLGWSVGAEFGALVSVLIVGIA